MADNYLERKRADYEERKKKWLEKKKQRPTSIARHDGRCTTSRHQRIKRKAEECVFPCFFIHMLHQRKLLFFAQRLRTFIKEPL